MPLKRWQKIGAGAVGTLVILALIAYRAVEVSITEFYSPEWHSDSSAEAQQRGVFVKRVIAVPETVAWDSTPFRIKDAWIERRTHVEYAFLLWRRELVDSGFRLILRTEPIGQAGAVMPFSSADWLGYNDSLRFDTWSGSTFWLRTLHGDLPDTVRLRVLRRPRP
jgi:hypothetical protein